MKALLALLIPAAFALGGCDLWYGVTRKADVHELPDLAAVKARLEHPDRAIEKPPDTGPDLQADRGTAWNS